jgi:hypothetical protein
VQVPVHVLRDPLTDDGDARTAVTLTATSETDPAKTATRTGNVHVRDTTPARGQAGRQGRAAQPASLRAQRAATASRRSACTVSAT